MSAWYNDTDPFVADWLRRLIKAGHIAPGVVDTRDIRDIHPNDLKPFTQLHFFAGIGGWSLALRAAGWPDDTPVWTGSCPCQPFSSSGRQKGFDDDRHLWPHWFLLIASLQPATIFGEQVASKPALDWFDLVSANLETKGYSVGAADICAAGLGAPHIRQRLWFGATRRVADASGSGQSGWVPDAGAAPKTPSREATNQPAGPGDPGRLGNTARGRCGQTRSTGAGPKIGAADARSALRLANANRTRSQGRARKPRADQRIARTAGLDNPWRNPDWIWCRDDRWRPTEPGLCPLAHGLPNRVGRLRAYGNAIVPQVAAAFVKAYEDVR